MASQTSRSPKPQELRSKPGRDLKRVEASKTRRLKTGEYRVVFASKWVTGERHGESYWQKIVCFYIFIVLNVMSTYVKNFQNCQLAFPIVWIVCSQLYKWFRYDFTEKVSMMSFDLNSFKVTCNCMFQTEMVIKKQIWISCSKSLFTINLTNINMWGRVF